MGQIVRTGETIESRIRFPFPECAEVEHDVQVAHLLDLRVSGDPFGMFQHRSVGVTPPGFQVVRQRDPDTFFAVRASFGIVIHDERGAEQPFRGPDHRTFVQRVALPWPGVRIGGRHDRSVEAFPFVGPGDLPAGAGHAYVQHAGFVSLRGSADVGQPVAAVVFSGSVAAAPAVVLQREVSPALGRIPASPGKRQDRSERVPFQ